MADLAHDFCIDLRNILDKIRIIAFTHKTLTLEMVGALHINDENKAKILAQVQKNLHLPEIMMLATCNRVEFIMAGDSTKDIEPLNLLQNLYPAFSAEQLTVYTDKAMVFSGKEAVKHIFEVSASIDSLVIGEREIITQVRQAYEFCFEAGLCKDSIRLLIQSAIVAAKEVYTHTSIADKPVSVVSLAFRKLSDAGLKPESKILVIGAGATNQLMLKLLSKHGFHNFYIFNRTYDKALNLAQQCGGKAYPLNELTSFTTGFDVLLVCTAATEYILNQEVYRALIQNDPNPKIIVDLGVPRNVDPVLKSLFSLRIIDVHYLKQLADENLKHRQHHLNDCHLILEKHVKEFEPKLKQRRVEMAMGEIPRLIKDINYRAVNEVFAGELSAMDDKSRESVLKILQYVEKKYIGVPMKMAKEILLAD